MVTPAATTPDLMQGVPSMALAAQIVLFDGFDPLDAIAPFEVLAAGSDEVDGTLHVELVSAEGPRDRTDQVSAGRSTSHLCGTLPGAPPA
jgi:putative intracellular protease/amidase